MSFLPTRARPLASALPSSLARFSTSSVRPTASAAESSTAGRPKRSPTAYGIPSSVPKADWPKRNNSGRSWSSFELRRKSFEDMHKLWYVLLRERNVLLTQREEARRLRVDLRGFSNQADKLRLVQKSMARVKQVVSERRHAALQAAEILRQRGDAEGADRIAQEGKELDAELNTTA